MKPFSILDWDWLFEAFGGSQKKLQAALSNPLDLAKIAFHQLRDEDKRRFLKQSVKVVDEEGNEVSLELGGAKLFASLMQAGGELEKVSRAVCKTIGISQPILDAIELEALKKNESNSPKT